MPGFYQSFTTSRSTEPDPATLLAQLRALDATAGVQHNAGAAEYILKKATAWTAPQITAAQNVLNTAPAATPQLAAQAQVDVISIFDKALVLALLDEINVVRAALSPPLTARTPAQAIAAIRAKAGTL